MRATSTRQRSHEALDVELGVPLEGKLHVPGLEACKAYRMKSEPLSHVDMSDHGIGAVWIAPFGILSL